MITISQEAADWFKEIKYTDAAMMDAFHMCFIVGAHAVLKDKRTTVLEFGSGWSSLIFCLALDELNKKYFKEMRRLRRNNPFELFILENEKKYLNITKHRIVNFKKSTKFMTKINWHFSDCEMTLFENKIATQYKKIPLCNPDFIYLDGPDQFKIKKEINGVHTGHNDLMPMACDILKFEYFLRV